MEDLENKTRKQLIKELEKSNKRIAELEKFEVEHKQIRETMQDKDRLYRTLINNLPGFTYRCLNDENWTMSYISEGCKELTGYPQKDFINNKNIAFNDIIDTGYQQKLWNMWQNALKEKTTFEYEYPIITKSGQIRWVWERGCGIYSDDGKLQFLEGFITDITDRKRAEELLRIERDNLESIFNAIEDGIYIVNQQYDIQYVNPVLVKDFGVYEGRKCYEYFHDRTEVCPWCKNADVFAGKTVRWEWFSSKNGKTYDLIDTPLKNPDGSISKLEIFRDITERKQADEEIRKLSKVVETTPDAVVITDMQGTIEYVNQGLLILGSFKNNNLIIGKPVFMFSNEEGVEQLKEEIIPTILSEGNWSGEVPVKRKDGSIFPADMVCSLILDEKGKPKYLLFQFHDITKRKKAEEKLRESERRLRSLFEESADAVLLLKKGRFIDCNQSAVDILCMKSKEQILNCKPSDISPEFQPDGQRSDKKSVKMNDIAFEKGNHRFEWIHTRVNGEEFPVEVMLTSIKEHDEQYFHVVWRDITNRKNSEEALKESEQRFRFIAKNTGDVLYRLQHDTMTFEYISPAITILTGYTAEEINKNHFISIVEQTVIPGDSDVSFEELEKKRKEGTTGEWRAEYKILSKSGEEKWLGDHSFPWKDDSGKIIGSTGILQNITERKLAELELAKHHEQVEELVIERTGEVERSQKSLVLLLEDVNEVNQELKNVNITLDATNKELEVFSYSVSHDLRAPLTRMDGFSKALIDSYSSNLDDKAVHFLNRIRASSQHMARLIDDLLSLSRITREKVTRQKVDLSQTVVNIANELKASKPTRNVNFKIAKELSANADRKFVVIILENLLGNAYKFTGKKKNAIIEFGKIMIDEDEVFFIKDNGAGFNMKYYDKIFTAFQRLHSDKEFTGTGIGLAIAQRIINKHGGKIWAESEEGKGTTFYFRFE